MKNKILNQKIRGKYRAQNRGQTMMEYIVLVALLAVASIPVVKILGDVFRDRVVASAHEIAGEAPKSQAKSIVSPASGKVRRSMKDFYQQ